PLGHEIWSRAFTGCATATLAGMVVDGQGRVTIGGGFTTDQACDSMIFGQHVVKAQLLQTRMFVTRLDALGTVIWARTGSQNTGGGKMYDRRAVKLALDDAGDTYVLTESVGCNASCFTRFVVSFDVNGTLMMD